MPALQPQLEKLRYNNAMTQKPVNYRKLNNELDQILEDLQAGELDIDEAIGKYERGAAIVKQLEAYLKSAENKVKKVLRANAKRS